MQSPMQSENIEAALCVLIGRALLDILSVGEKLQKHVARLYILRYKLGKCSISKHTNKCKTREDQKDTHLNDSGKRN